VTELLLGIISAFWFGILTSISPCPMATNISAISFVGRKVGNPRQVLISGLLYTLGRMLTYLVLGVILVSSLLSAPVLSHNLQKYLNLVLGPILILVGMVLLDLISFSFGMISDGKKLQSRVEKLGVWGAGLLGILFALSFCPTSAALFFGSLMTLALKLESGILLPSVYGIATGLPVVIFAVIIAYSANKLGNFYKNIVVFEKWAKFVTGVIFILIGIYFSLTLIFEIHIF
jgi:cytochrome c-type biogenesis protein